MSSEKKNEKQPIKPTFLKRAGTLILEDGIDPTDIIFFHGRKNVQLSKVNKNEYAIFITESDNNI